MPRCNRAAAPRSSSSSRWRHLERFGPEADGVMRALALRHDVELVAKDDEGHRLYRLIK